MYTKAQAKEVLIKLVQKFEEHKFHYTSSKYDESNTRRDFIDPFFELLGWDVGNSAGKAPDKREVILEDPVETKDSWSNPDYIFYFKGDRKFIVEAKKPSVDLQGKQVVLQAKSYAWNARLPVAVLTDFEEFRVFDATLKPHLERPKIGIIKELDLRYTDYVKRFDDLWDVFSKEAIEQLLYRKTISKTN